MNYENELPPYSLRRSLRARSVSLHICPRRGLELVVPQRFNHDKIPSILLKHQRWIAKTWQRIQPRLDRNEEDYFPKQLDIRAFNEIWHVQYQPNEGGFLRVITASNTTRQLLLIGKTQDRELIKQVLQKWLHRQARRYLLPRLKQWSEQIGLVYHHAGIRNATTRWGSCSVKKRISLNYKLLFLPAELVDYVIIHELCHLVHLNHSKRFWHLLQHYNPHSHVLRKELKQAERHIPLWLE